MPLDCAQLQTDYDDLNAAIRKRMKGEMESMIKDGEKEIAYAQVSLSDMIKERTAIADQLATFCGIDVSGSSSRVFSPGIRRSY